MPVVNFGYHQLEKNAAQRYDEKKMSSLLPPSYKKMKQQVLNRYNLSTFRQIFPPRTDNPRFISELIFV
jgi:hypothetical protein